MRTALCAASQLPGGGGGGALMWMMPLHLHVNQKSDYPVCYNDWFIYLLNIPWPD